MNRGDSFSSAMRSAASFAKAFSSRFHDLKNNMSPNAGGVSQKQSSTRSSVSSESSRSSVSAADGGPASSTTVEKVIEEDEGDTASLNPEADRTPQAADPSASQIISPLTTTPKALHASHDLLDAKTPSKYASPLGKLFGSHYAITALVPLPPCFCVFTLVNDDLAVIYTNENRVVMIPVI